MDQHKTARWTPPSNAPSNNFRECNSSEKWEVASCPAKAQALDVEMILWHQSCILHYSPRPLEISILLSFCCTESSAIKLMQEYTTRESVGQRKLLSICTVAMLAQKTNKLFSHKPNVSIFYGINSIDTGFYHNCSWTFNPIQIISHCNIHILFWPWLEIGTDQKMTNCAGLCFMANNEPTNHEHAPNGILGAFSFLLTFSFLSSADTPLKPPEKWTDLWFILLVRAWESYRFLPSATHPPLPITFITFLPAPAATTSSSTIILRSSGAGLPSQSHLLPLCMSLPIS